MQKRFDCLRYYHYYLTENVNGKEKNIYLSMKTISLCMIVKNEQKTLERCLCSAKEIADEIIVVDTGSTDKTVEIAKKFTQKVYHFDWCDDFSVARNYAISFALCDYVMWLDADDVVPQKTAKIIKNLKQKMSADVYQLKYDIAFENGKPTFSFFRERIIKNCNRCRFVGAVHECIVPFGKVEQIDASIWHKKVKKGNPNRNIKIYRKIEKERKLLPREQYYFGRELFDHKKYKKCARILSNFLKENKGWIENNIDACFLLSLCYEQIGNIELTFSYLFKSFEYDKPRANFCCQIGDMLFKNENIETAMFWYNLATKCEDVTKKGGFVQPLYYDYYPYLQLCVCNYKLGNIAKAKYFNSLAGRVNRNSEIVKQNALFFENFK